MNKKIAVALLSILILPAMWGCGNQSEPTEPTTMATVVTEPTVPSTVPEDGNPNDVTCKGSYTTQTDANAVVARIGDAVLTNGQISAWYWAQASQYQLEGHETAPDFSKPLDTQICQIDDSVGSWQQYFLQQALNAWHSAKALELQGQEDGIPTDETYKPIEKNHEKYMTGMPATSVLHGYNKPYRPNTLHQAYLDGIPELMDTLAQENGYADGASMAEAAFGCTEEDLAEYIRLYNWGYMYFTSLAYSSVPTEEDILQMFAQKESDYAALGIDRNSGYDVDIRHILILPETAAIEADGTVVCSDEDWAAGLLEAEELLSGWARKHNKSEATFAELANKNSDDTGSALNGGSYRNIRKGQLIPALDEWCFDGAREAGDTTILRSDYGIHILYFAGKTDCWYAQAETDAAAQLKADLITQAKQRFPADIDYSAISLPEARASVAAGDVLYPDIAHERFPEVPLYLQQDYPGTMFGAYELRTHGCGITTWSMLASYLTDEEWTPPEMCARYRKYSYANGTDGMIFVNEPQVMGFYLIQKTYEPTIAKAALEEGHIVISIQHPGYWTRGGHYLLLESINEDGLIQVRDSNIFNYERVKTHKDDLHTWGCITSAGSGYWIYDYKITRIPACSRCGSPEENNAPLVSDYICEKCQPALLRRSIWLQNN